MKQIIFKKEPIVQVVELHNVSLTIGNIVAYKTKSSTIAILIKGSNQKYGFVYMHDMMLHRNDMYFEDTNPRNVIHNAVTTGNSYERQVLLFDSVSEFLKWGINNE